MLSWVLNDCEPLSSLHVSILRVRPRTRGGPGEEPWSSLHWIARISWSKTGLNPKSILMPNLGLHTRPCKQRAFLAGSFTCPAVKSCEGPLDRWMDKASQAIRGTVQARAESVQGPLQTTWRKHCMTASKCKAKTKRLQNVGLSRGSPFPRSGMSPWRDTSTLGLGLCAAVCGVHWGSIHKARAQVAGSENQRGSRHGRRNRKRNLSQEEKAKGTLDNFGPVNDTEAAFARHNLA